MEHNNKQKGKSKQVLLDKRNLIKKSLQRNSEQAWWQPAVLIFAKFSSWIAAPVIVAIILGKWLDKKYNTEPWIFLVCVSIAFIISMAGLIKGVVEEYKKIEKEMRKNNQDTKNKDAKNSQ